MVLSFTVWITCFISSYSNGHKDIQNKIIKCSGVNANFKSKSISSANKDKICIEDKVKYDLLYRCIKLKAEQCILFREKLLDSKGKYLVEWAWWGDTEYGCVLQDGIFKGKNACGRIMMKVREEL